MPIVQFTRNMIDRPVRDKIYGRQVAEKVVNGVFILSSFCKNTYVI